MNISRPERKSGPKTEFLRRLKSISVESAGVAAG
jgi:hypothetical protein